MAKFMSTRNLVRVTELNSDFICLNNYIHDSTTFLPTYLGLLEYYNQSTFYLFTKEVIRRAAYQVTTREYKNLRQFAHFWRFTSDPRLTLGWYRLTYTPTYIDLLQELNLTQFDGQHKKFSVSPTGTAPSIARFFFEDNTYIRYIVAGGYSSNFPAQRCGVYNYNKFTNVVSGQPWYVNNTVLVPIHVNNNGDLYTAIVYQNAQGRFDVYKNLTGATTGISLFSQQAPSALGNHSNFPSNVYKKFSTGSRQYFYFPMFTAADTITIYYAELDTATDTVTPVPTTINQASNPNGNEFTGIPSGEVSAVRDLYIIEDGTADYLIFFEYHGNLGNTAKNNVKVYVFEIDPVNPKNLTYVSQTDLKQGSFRLTHVFALDYEQKLWFIQFSQNNRLLLLRFNQTTKAFDLIPYSTSIYDEIGVDSLGRIWLRNSSDGFQYIESIGVPYTVDIKVQNTAIQYDGTNINTDFTINAFNYLGDRIQATIEVALFGPVEYTDGTKLKVITTSDISDTIIPIVITGAGYIQIVPRIII